MAVYNDTNVSNALNPLDSLTAMNQLSDGLLITALIFVLYMMIFIGFKHKPTRVTMSGASFLVTFIALQSYFLEWIKWQILIFPMAMFFISLVIMLFYSE